MNDSNVFEVYISWIIISISYVVLANIRLNFIYDLGYVSKFCVKSKRFPCITCINRRGAWKQLRAIIKLFNLSKYMW